VNDADDPEFGLQLDKWIWGAAGGAHSFSELIRNLPGVFPTVAAERAETLWHLNNTLSVNGSNGVVCPRWPKLPMPHPLDYTWWYDRPTVERLSEIASESTTAGDLIGLLGTPTVFHYCQSLLSDRQLLLLDRDQAVIDALSGCRAPHKAVCCDVISGDLPPASARLVLADPPWYPNEMNQFLWAARQMSTRGGIVLFSCPPEGTRPRVLSDREVLFRWATELGFDLDVIESGALRYLSPPFERNSLKVSGLVVDDDWRCGDLVRFVCARDCTQKRPSTYPPERWEEEILDGVRIRIRPSVGSTVDVRLQPLVEGDILPTVSRRADIRSQVDVWTSGNRVFRCEGREAFRIALRANREGVNPVTQIEEHLGLALTRDQQRVVLETVDQVKAIVAKERIECG
jgi:hypothetical protein